MRGVRMNTPYCGLLLVLTCVAGAAHAASFDCARAATPVENLICADAILSQDDEDLADAYSQALAQDRQAASVRTAQRQWLTHVRNQCVDLPCLREAYARRLQVVEAARNLPARDPALVPCRQVAEHARRGVFDKLRVPRTGEHPLAMLGEAFSSLDVDNLTAEFWYIDLDGDSVTDRLAIAEQGTMRAATAYGRSGKPGSDIVMLNEIENGDVDLDVLKIDGRYYIMSSASPAHDRWTVWRMHAQEGFIPVCVLQPRREPVIKLTAGWGHPVCEAAWEGSLEPVEFDVGRSLAPLSTQPGQRFWAMSPDPGMAHVDIDNDGRAEYVFNLGLNSSAGRGCIAGRLAVADESGRDVPDNWLNRQLLRELGFSCESVLEIAMHEGTAYLDAGNRAGDRTIYRIDSQQVNSVCEFRAVPAYEILGDSTGPSR